MSDSNSKKISLFKLFLIFAKIGAISLGGGYVILPIIISELSHKNNLVKEDDIIDYFALSQSLPGIIAANISMFVGYKVRGKLGAIIAAFGVTFIPFWTIVLLASFVEKHMNNIYLAGILWGVSCAVVALILLTTREMWQKSVKNAYFYVILFSTFLSLQVFHLSPIKAIIVFTIFGVLYKRFLEVKK